MNNIEKWPQAFENGIPKVGGRWKGTGGFVAAEHVITNIKGGGPRFRNACGVEDWWYLKRYLNGDLAFLGFSDPPLAAAPQAAAVEACTVRGLFSNLNGACGNVAIFRWTPRGGGWSEAVRMCPVHHAERAPSHAATWTFTPIGPPAPVPAPKAAVREEGLAILPQTGVRHEPLEARARMHEKGGDLEQARYAAIAARQALAADLAYDLEASAVRDGRVVLKSALREMGAGDRACYVQRGLREFAVMASPAHWLHFWWKR